MDNKELDETVILETTVELGFNVPTCVVAIVPTSELFITISEELRDEALSVKFGECTDIV